MESFRPLTRDALARGRVRAKEAAIARKEAAAQRKAAAAQRKAAAAAAASSNSMLDASISSLVGPNPVKAPPAEEVVLPNRKLTAGLKLPPNLSNYFSVKRLAGRPLEDIDAYYEDKEVSVGGEEIRSVIVGGALVFNITWCPRDVTFFVSCLCDIFSTINQLCAHRCES